MSVEKLILDQCGGMNLEEIRSLDLSNTNLTSLDMNILNKCVKLFSLDVSKNQLKDLTGLACPSLRSLNFEDNSITDLKFLSRLSNLEILYFDGNPLSVADRYIAVDQLPNLRSFDGKPCGDLQKLTKEFGEKLKKQGDILYELKYQKIMKSCSDAQERNSCQKQFLRELLNKVSSCSGVPPSYMRFKVQNFIDNIAENVPPSVADSFKELELSPARSRRNAASPRKLPPRKVSPRKIILSQNILTTPKKNKHVDDHLDVSPSKRSKHVERFLDFEPQLALRVHSNEHQDDNTPVWCAAFEPNISDERKTTDIVATCGGSVVCFTNFKTSHVLMKYKSEFRTENLYSLAWTILLAPENKSKVTVAAAGGTNKKIYLIIPSRKICYSSFKAHNQAIDTLHFHPINKTWLFSGGKDKNIHLWDIGSLQWLHLKTSQKKLMTFDAGAEALRMLVSPSYDCLFAATDRGLMAWNLAGDVDAWTRNPCTSLTIPENCKSENSDMVDGMVFLSEKIMATKVSQSGKIFLWDFSTMFSGKKIKKSNFKISPIVTFLWSDCSTDYIYIDCCKESGILACGDNLGRIWIYDVEKYTKRNFPQVIENNVQTPNVVFPWPKLVFEEEKMAVREKVIINSVKFDWSGEYLVICTDSNLIPIWRRI